MVSQSSIEAEYKSLAGSATELCWLQSLFQEFCLPLPPALVCCDNLSTIALAKNPILHARTKHVEIDLHFVRDKVLDSSLVLQHVSSFDQVADCLTKPLTSAHFASLKAKLTVVPS